MVVAEGIDGAQDESGDQGAEKWPPQRLQGEVVTHLLLKVHKHIGRYSTVQHNNTVLLVIHGV